MRLNCKDKNPASLSVTDLQLICAISMRQGVDLTQFISKVDGGYELGFSPTEEIRMTAVFDEFGFTDGIKFEVIK